jgi:hypothetical protein
MCKLWLSLLILASILCSSGDSKKDKDGSSGSVTKKDDSGKGKTLKLQGFKDKKNIAIFEVGDEARDGKLKLYEKSKGGDSDGDKGKGVGGESLQKNWDRGVSEKRGSTVEVEFPDLSDKPEDSKFHFELETAKGDKLKSKPFTYDSKKKEYTLSSDDDDESEGKKKEGEGWFWKYIWVIAPVGIIVIGLGTFLIMKVINS